MFSKRFLALVVAGLVVFAGWQSVCAQTLDEILKKHVEALGGEEALKAIKSSEAEFEVTLPGGISGTQKSYFKYPNKLRSEMDLKIMQSSSVYNGEKGWIQDPSGQVRELAGPELEGVATEVYFNLYGYLFPERAKGEVEYLGREQSEGVNYHVLKVTPEGADPIKLYINPQTYLIDKSVGESDIVEVTTHYQDYKDFQGVRMATSFRSSTGDTSYDMRSRLIYAEFNPSLSDSLFLAPKPAPPDYTFVAGKTSTEIPFVLASNHIHIPVVIDKSRPLNFILDSGAGGPVMDTDVAKELGLQTVGKLEARGAGEGTQEANFIRLPNIRLGDVVIDSTSGAAISLKFLDKYEGMPIEGIVGYDLFSRFVVKIDYQNQKLTLYEPSSFKYQGKGQSIPITLENNHPHVKAIVDGKYEGNFVIDCGARSSLTLYTPFVEEHNLVAKSGKTIDVLAGVGVGGKVMGKATRMQSMKIGDFVIPAPLTNLSSAKAGALSSEKTAGNIGGGILKRFTVIFDYGDSRMILEPNANFAYEDNLDMAGLWLTRENDSTKVDFVVDDSPAANAGIKEGDVIVKINGQPAKDLQLRDIRRTLMSGAGEAVTLTINSAGKERTIDLKLEKLI
jgi:outer membrane lipoprotein-sorting protein